MTSTPAFEAIGISVRRGERTLIEGLDLRLERGSIHAVVGGNGSGKSSLVAALAGDLAVASGEIRIAGMRLNDLSDREQAKRRAVLMQNQPPLPFSARDVVELAGPTLTRVEVDALLNQFDLADLSDRPLMTLSGGERGRAMLAMAIAQGTPTLLLDEPTAAFDRRYRSLFTDWLRIWREEGKAILIVTHDAEIESIADAVTSLD